MSCTVDADEVHLVLVANLFQILPLVCCSCIILVDLLRMYIIRETTRTSNNVKKIKSVYTSTHLPGFLALEGPPPPFEAANVPPAAVLP